VSLILDALRKSENQRQRQAGPGLAVVPEGRESSRPATWLLVLGALLILNVLVLAALLLTGRPSDTATADRASPAVAEPAPVPPRPTAGAPATAAREEPLRPTPVTLPARPHRNEVRPLNTEVAAAPAASAPRAVQEPQTSIDAPPPVPVAAAPTVQQANEDARLPRFADLVVRGELNVPHMHVDIHVFSAVAAERFVFINMRKYGEGQATQEGPRVERITRDGVVMDYQGQRFFLARD
jgi:general secretion pathway protein B